MNRGAKLDVITLQIKAIHARGRRALTVREAVALLEKLDQVYMGVPTSTQKKRGRKRKTLRTQYDEAYERRRALYFRLVRLPVLRTGKRTLNHEEIERLFLALLDQGVPPRKLVSTVLADLQRDQTKPCPDERTLRRILARMRSNFQK